MKDFNPTPEFEEKVRQAMDVPNANPEFVDTLRNELVRRPVRMKTRFMFKPAWALAFVLALAVILIGVPPLAQAIGRLFGYVPEVGLVENTGDLRMLAEPVSQTRDGVTLTISYVMVDQTHVEVIYDTQGIPAQNDSNQAADAMTNPKAFCGGVQVGDTYNKEGDPILKLPDGTLLERDLTGKYPQNVFAMKPVYEAQIPADVLELTFVLKCIPNARLGAVPENWEVPFRLKSVPADAVLGAPVIDVEQPTVEPTKEISVSPTTTESALPSPVVKMTLEKFVPMDSATIFYFSLNMENKDPSLVSIMPVDVYVLDSLGQKIALHGNFTFQPYEHPAGSLFEYTSEFKPADGPLTVIVENAVAYFAPLHVDPPQATPEELTFTFDVGDNPQHGQVWELDKEFSIAGYPLKITSARAITFDDILTPELIAQGLNSDGSQGFDFGYQFEVHTDPAVKENVEMDIMTEPPRCLSILSYYFPTSSSPLREQLCRDNYPSGMVKVTIRELSVLLENSWQSTWTP